MWIFFRGGVCSKTLFLKIMAEDLIGWNILPWVIELHPECGLHLFLRSSLHTSPATDICEKSLKSWFGSLTPPPNIMGGVMKYTPPLKKFNTFDRFYCNHILGIKIWAFPTVKWSTRRKSVGGFFRNWRLHYVMNLCLIFFKSPQ